MRTSYAELLQDPRWQKKRLEIMQRDDFTCQTCANSDRTLHVHHLCYIKGRKPWEYLDSFLVTLCAECHGGAGVARDSDGNWFPEEWEGNFHLLMNAGSHSFSLMTVTTIMERVAFLAKLDGGAAATLEDITNYVAARIKQAEAREVANAH